MCNDMLIYIDHLDKDDIIGFIYFTEWWVKVVGSQSRIGLGRKTGVRSLRVAPLGSDLSPYWSIIDEDFRK